MLRVNVRTLSRHIVPSSFVIHSPSMPIVIINEIHFLNRYFVIYELLDKPRGAALNNGETIFLISSRINYTCLNDKFDVR